MQGLVECGVWGVGGMMSRPFQTGGGGHAVGTAVRCGVCGGVGVGEVKEGMMSVLGWTGLGWPGGGKCWRGGQGPSRWGSARLAASNSQ